MIVPVSHTFLLCWSSASFFIHNRVKLLVSFDFFKILFFFLFFFFNLFKVNFLSFGFFGNGTNSVKYSFNKIILKSKLFDFIILEFSENFSQSSIGIFYSHLGKFFPIFIFRVSTFLNIKVGLCLFII
jgi:hypothetical protein